MSASLLPVTAGSQNHLASAVAATFIEPFDEQQACCNTALTRR
jgi:hypothetical protein